jgi:hypothetical protein
MKRKIAIWSELVDPGTAMLITENFFKMAIARGKTERKGCEICGTTLCLYNENRKRCFRHQSSIIDPAFLGSAREIAEQRDMLLKEGLPKDKLPIKKNHFVPDKREQRKLPFREVA